MPALDHVKEAKGAAEETKRALLQKTDISLVAKKAALNELARLDKEVGLCQPPQIDCSLLFVLIGQFEKTIS